MKGREIMTAPVIRIRLEESVSVAARTLTHYNIGILPVCGGDGRVCGLVTDRDLVTRCLAAERNPGNTRVKDVMTGGVISVSPDMEAGAAAALMGRVQVRRLPVVENGRLCGMVSLGDLSVRPELGYDAGDALAEISGNLSDRD